MFSSSVNRSRASSTIGRVVGPLPDEPIISRTPSHGSATYQGSTNWSPSGEIGYRYSKQQEQKPVPVESEDYVRTRQCVVEALKKICRVTTEVAHEVLEGSIDFLDLVPIPCLAEAMRVVLNIWNAIRDVDTNRLTCLAIIERCATSLTSLREEIVEAGDEVIAGHQEPLVRLVKVYGKVYQFLVGQMGQPFIKRYLYRDKIQRELDDCDRSLTDALSMFSTSVQLRMAKQFNVAEKQRQADMAAILDCIHPQPLRVEDRDDLAQLQAFTAQQNERNTVQDAADLRQLMHAALQAPSDANMLDLLQVKRHEIPEMIKTLQRALEQEVVCERVELQVVVAAAEVPKIMLDGAALTPTATMVGSGSSCPSCERHDKLHRDLTEMAMNALQRLNGETTDLRDKQVQESPASRRSEPPTQISKSDLPNMTPIPLPLIPLETTAESHGQRTAIEYTIVNQTLANGHSEQTEAPPHVSQPDQGAQHIRDEEQYREGLQHEFHDSLTLALWTPSQVSIGAVGYHSKAKGGKFIILFNSFDPEGSSGGRTEDMPSMYGYGRVNTGSQRQDKRNVAQRGMDIIQSWISSHKAGEGKYSRQYSSQLRMTHKKVQLVTESTNHRYIADLETPRKWFKANVDKILEMYGAEHRISKEDLCLVIGTLEAREYALFVSHKHPNCKVHFKVSSAVRSGQPWGEFSFDLRGLHGGPRYQEDPTGSVQYARKISTYKDNGNWDTVLLARLRFQPGEVEPTSL